MRQDVYSGNVQLHGEESEDALLAAMNYGASLTLVGRFEEAKSLLRKAMPMARRVLGSNHDITLRIILIYTNTLYQDPGATFDDLREAVTTIEDAERIARRVFGGSHPLTTATGATLRNAQTRAILRARETPSPPGNA